MGGSMVGIHLAIMVFPEPGGPTISMLCLPLTATSHALLKSFCPLI